MGAQMGTPGRGSGSIQPEIRRALYLCSALGWERRANGHVNQVKTAETFSPGSGTWQMKLVTVSGEPP